MCTICAWTNRSSFICISSKASSYHHWLFSAFLFATNFAHVCSVEKIWRLPPFNDKKVIGARPEQPDSSPYCLLMFGESQNVSKNTVLLMPLVSPGFWKASLRCSSTLANHLTSFTKIMTYSGSTPGGHDADTEGSAPSLSRLCERRLCPTSQVLVEPVRESEWCLDAAEAWPRFTPPPSLLLRSILAARSVAGELLY